MLLITSNWMRRSVEMSSRMKDNVCFYAAPLPASFFLQSNATSRKHNTNYPISFFPALLSLLCVNWNTIGNYPSIIHRIRWAMKEDKPNTLPYRRTPNERWKHYSTRQASKHDTNVLDMRTLSPNTECLQNKWSFHVVSAALHRCTLASLGLRGMHLDSPAVQTRFYPFTIATHCHDDLDAANKQNLYLGISSVRTVLFPLRAPRRGDDDGRT